MQIKIFGLAFLLLLMPQMAQALDTRLFVTAAPEKPLYLATEYLGKLLSERSSDRIQVRIQSGSDSDCISYLQSSEPLLALCGIEQITAELPWLRLLQVPFLIQDRDQLHQLLKTEAGMEFLNHSRAIGLETLALWEEGFHQLLADRPLSTPEQLAGLSFAPSLVEPAAAYYLSLGANLSSGDRQGEAPQVTVVSLGRLAELEDESYTDLTVSNHAVTGSLLLTNRDFWQNLPLDLQVIMTGAIADATSYARELTLEQQAAALRNLRETDKFRVHTLSNQERAAWRQRLKGNSLPELAEGTEKLQRILLDTL